MKYNKSEIMTRAWELMDIDVCEVEWLFYFSGDATFSNCLKQAWAEAKEEIEEQAKYDNGIANSENVKAWDWAARKLNVSFDVTDSNKVFNVDCEIKRSGNNISIYQAAMRAVKLHIKIEKSNLLSA